MAFYSRFERLDYSCECAEPLHFVVTLKDGHLYSDRKRTRTVRELGLFRKVVTPHRLPALTPPAKANKYIEGDSDQT